MTHTLITPDPVSEFHYPVWDEIDASVVEARLIARAAYQVGPLAGDWVRLDGGGLFQLAESGTSPKFTRDGGLFYFERNGTLSYRGDWLGGVPPLDILCATAERHASSAYIFHHDKWRRGREVGFVVGLRVWQSSRLRHYPVAA
jgi:hypothetical protein